MRHFPLLFAFLIVSFECFGCGSKRSGDEEALAQALQQDNLPKAAELVEKVGSKSINVLMQECPLLPSTRKDGCMALLGLKGAEYKSKIAFEFLLNLVKNGSGDDAAYAAYGLVEFKDWSVVPELKKLEARVTDAKLKKRVAHSIEILERTGK